MANCDELGIYFVSCFKQKKNSRKATVISFHVLLLSKEQHSKHPSYLHEQLKIHEQLCDGKCILEGRYDTIGRI